MSPLVRGIRDLALHSLHATIHQPGNVTRNATQFAHTCCALRLTQPHKRIPLHHILHCRTFHYTGVYPALSVEAAESPRLKSAPESTCPVLLSGPPCTVFNPLQFHLARR